MLKIIPKPNKTILQKIEIQFIFFTSMQRNPASLAEPSTGSSIVRCPSGLCSKVLLILEIFSPVVCSIFSIFFNV